MVKRQNLFRFIIIFFMSVSVLFAKKEREKFLKFLCDGSIITRGDVYKWAVYFGKVYSKKQAYIFTDLPGKLIKYTVKEGDFVKKDQVIALIDRSIPGVRMEPLRVKSPIDGRVGILYFKKGEMVLQSKPLALIYGVNQIVEVELTPSVLRKVKIGAISLIENEGEVLKGNVISVSKAVDPLTMTGKVRIGNLPPVLTIGDIVKVKIAVSRRSNVLRVPKEAVVEREDKTKIYIYKNGRVKEVEIKKGLEGDRYIEILDVLKGRVEVGDTVITRGAEALFDGASVELREVK